MPTVLVRAVEPTKMAFQRALPIQPLGLIKKAAGPQRCLFGVPDHQESIRVAQNEIKVEQQRLATKYNFDFENDAPLPGKFQYEKIVRSPDAAESRLHEGAAEDKENSGSSSSASAHRNLLTDFYTVSRKRACPFDSPRPAKKSLNASATPASSATTRAALAEVCE
ncbi:hypothetical protein BIW11_13900 [Tropilaelaps mercedesae]|uniref:Cyclin-dependent kinase inhibitor domain-containing protein n=1 Tax=Tropilaelaps mercedesae TaxID=418985 RepID=A0A1V9X0B1_9ACAR|nr:hypothetical protein BIW11_13900 [Tropilaelaps mercedesae]